MPDSSKRKAKTPRTARRDNRLRRTPQTRRIQSREGWFRGKFLPTLAALLAAFLVLLWLRGAVLMLSRFETGMEGDDVAPGLRGAADSLDLAPVLLTGADAGVTVSASVRGNLGPPSVLLNSGEDWIRDRWQAASDMGGTAIGGKHWVMLDFSAGTEPLAVSRVVLDWEAAYCEDYVVEVRVDDGDGSEDVGGWKVLYDGSDPDQQSSLLTANESGQSPGVEKKMPLHVVHDIGPLPSSGWSGPIHALRITMRKPARGWGVSLWRVEAYGVLSNP